MDLLCPSPVIPMLTRLAAVGAATAALAFAPMPSRASIVDAPASIVDHGTYITDTAHGRDWYKFSNADSTIGLSFEAAMTHFAGTGWSSASIEQVQTLEGTFGWASDTPGAVSNANFGLTYAMASYLGYTAIVAFPDGPATDVTYFLDGLVSNVIVIGGTSFHAVSQSDTYEVDDPRDFTILYGDAVEGLHGAVAFGGSDEVDGVWLTRASLPAAGDPGAGPAAVPEPATWLLMVGGVAAAMSERRRAIRRRASIP